MRRIPHDNKDSEEAWCFPVLPYSSHDGVSELHAVKLTKNPRVHKAGEPSTTKEKHEDDQNPTKEEHKGGQNLLKAFIWRAITTIWKVCRYIVLNLLTTFVIIVIYTLIEMWWKGKDQSGHRVSYKRREYKHAGGLGI